MHRRVLRRERLKSHSFDVALDKQRPGFDSLLLFLQLETSTDECRILKEPHRVDNRLVLVRSGDQVTNREQTWKGTEETVNVENSATVQKRIIYNESA